MSIENVRVYVICRDGIVRNPALISQLHAANVASEIISICSAAEKYNIDVDQAAACTLKRLPLTPREIFASLAHKEAVRKASINDFGGWSIFLEDDAVPTQSFELACKCISNIDENKALAIMLYRDPVSLLSLRKKTVGKNIFLRKILGTPEGAVGYALNVAAIHAYPTEGSIKMVADWPYPWSVRVNFLQLDPPAIALGDFPSLINKERTSQWEKVSDSVVLRFFMLLSTVSCFRYFKRRNVYGAWKDYFLFEQKRFTHALIKITIKLRRRGWRQTIRLVLRALFMGRG